ncbi:MAG: hypothetical protein ABDH23_04845 [Endomicrobiia bacterium]
MHFQYSQNFPGVIIDENNKNIYLNKENFYSQLENYYEKIINNDFNYFEISSDFSLGIYEFVKYLGSFEKLPQNIKFQTIGPITFGLSIKDNTKKAIFYDDQIRETIIKHLTMKSVWQIKYVLDKVEYTKLKRVFLFYDEPYLAAYGSAFSGLSKEEIQTCLAVVIEETKQLTKQIFPDIELKAGIHCCANTDWSLLTSLDNLDIISFDAYDFFENFLLYSDDIKKFIEKNKTIAWGIIPNTEKIFTESTETVVNKLKNFIESLSNKSINKEALIKNLIITPQCGLGNSTEEITKKVFEICNQIKSMKFF